MEVDEVHVSSPLSTCGNTETVLLEHTLGACEVDRVGITEDVHAVAACLAPALVRGEARYRLEEIANRTGLSQHRVHDCLRMLLKRGCVRQTGCTPDGAPIFVLP